MSCDNLASHAIATIGAGFSPETRTQLQAVYDLPPTLQPGEDGAAIARAAQGLLLGLKAKGARIPSHLNVSKPEARAAVRFGRLAQALTKAQAQAGQPASQIRVTHLPDQPKDTPMTTSATLGPDQLRALAEAFAAGPVEQGQECSLCKQFISPVDALATPPAGLGLI